MKIEQELTPSLESVEVETTTDHGVPSSLIGNSVAGSVWTLVSRVTGLGRIVVVGAVLGATYLGNTYQGINALPNLIYYQLLAGSLFVSLLVPPLVRHIREGNSDRADTLVRGFLGWVLGISVLAALILMAAGPLILRLMSLGVSDHAVAAAQRRVGALFLIMFAPQIALYAIAGTGAAVMNAYGRFALAAGAPAAESIGMILTLLSAALIFGTGTALGAVHTSEVVLLGIGTTTAVALHATLQWVGARRRGSSMIPSAQWRDPEIRAVLRRVGSVFAYTGLAAAQLFAAIVVANRVAGGLIGFQLALNFFYLPTAIVTWPIARALVPRLSHLHQSREMQTFREELLRTIALASFVTAPIAAAYVLLASPIAHTVAFGQLRSPTAIGYMAVSMAALAPAVLGETWFILGSYAFYSQQDVRTPLRSMAVRVGTTLVLMIPAWNAHGSRVLLLLGLAVSAGSIVGAIDIRIRANRQLPKGDYSLFRSLGKTIIGCAVMTLPALLAWVGLRPVAVSKLGELARLFATVATGVVTFLGVQILLRAPEVSLIRTGFARFGRRSGRP